MVKPENPGMGHGRGAEASATKGPPPWAAVHGERMGVGMKRFSRDVSEINRYQQHVKQELKRTGGKPLIPEIAALRETIRSNAFVRMYFEKMLTEVEPQHQHFTTIDEMLAAINFVVHTAPVYKDVDSISWQFPLSALMNFWMMTPSGRTVLRMPQLNKHLNDIMAAWCNYLNTPASCYVLTDEKDGWLNKRWGAWEYNKLDEYYLPDPKAPHCGFKCYNEFFHRDIKPGMRPTDGEGDPSVVVSPNDGVAWAVQENASLEAEFWLKSQKYSLRDMFDNSPLTKSFEGGTVYQTYVNGGADWHRFTSPVDGTVVECRIVRGYAWTESDVIEYDPMSGPFSQGWAAGVATRALIFIDTGVKKLGTVCVVPIGLTEVSSVEMITGDGKTAVTPEGYVGTKVKKGQQLGWFSFGGSSFAMVFQKDALKKIDVMPPAENRNNQSKQTLWANKKFATANIT